jgi:hypothetical protein
VVRMILRQLSWLLIFTPVTHITNIGPISQHNLELYLGDEKQSPSDEGHLTGFCIFTFILTVFPCIQFTCNVISSRGHGHCVGIAYAFPKFHVAVLVSRSDKYLVMCMKYICYHLYSFLLTYPFHPCLTQCTENAITCACTQYE